VHSVSRLTKKTTGRRSERGFTLIELMTVVIIISIVAVAAVPSMLESQRERRGFQGAADIAALFREARSRASGRGVAVQVAFTVVSGAADGVMREAPARTVTASGQTIGGLGSCTGTNWATAPIVGTVSVNGGIYAQDQTVVTMSTSAGAVQTATICFTPGGRAIVDAANAGGTAVANTGVVTLNVRRSTGGISRNVILPVTGAPRIISI
jgi:prepilin-type N-terminal cleavage/methylation domain-containing protein